MCVYIYIYHYIHTFICFPIVSVEPPRLTPNFQSCPGPKKTPVQLRSQVLELQSAATEAGEIFGHVGRFSGTV